MRTTTLLPLTLSILLISCGMNVPRPIKTACGAEKKRTLELISAMLIRDGYTISFSSADAGTIQAEYAEGAGLFSDGGKRQVSIQVDRDTVVMNYRTMSRYNGSESVQTFDLENAHGETLGIVQALIDGVRGACTANPLNQR